MSKNALKYTSHKTRKSQDRLNGLNDELDNDLNEDLDSSYLPKVLRYITKDNIGTYELVKVSPRDINGEILTSLGYII